MIKSKVSISCFRKTAEEKQIRVLEEGDALEKGKLSGIPMGSTLGVSPGRP